MTDERDFKSELKQTATDIVKDVLTLDGFKSLNDVTRETLKSDLEKLRLFATSTREPRIAIIGNDDVLGVDILSKIFKVAVDPSVAEQLVSGRWYPLALAQGTIHWLDARAGCFDDGLDALEFDQPDIIIWVNRSGDQTLMGDRFEKFLWTAEENSGRTIPTVATIVRDEQETTPGNTGDFKTQSAIRDEFDRIGLSRTTTPIVPMVREGKLLRTVANELSDDTRLALARMCGDRETQREASDQIVKLAAAINSAIASVPLPVADVVPITSVQVLMTAGIAYVGGHSMDWKTMSKFAVASGANVGAGVAMRELVRAVVQIVPFAGPFVSASIAAGGTITLGKAATKFFIEMD